MVRANVSVMPIKVQLGSKWRISIDNYQGAAEEVSNNRARK